MISKLRKVVGANLCVPRQFEVKGTGIRGVGDKRAVYGKHCFTTTVICLLSLCLVCLIKLYGGRLKMPPIVQIKRGRERFLWHFSPPCSTLPFPSSLPPSSWQVRCVCLPSVPKLRDVVETHSLVPATVTRKLNLRRLQPFEHLVCWRNSSSYKSV